MKCAIITCHDVYNSGASLQAYALSKYLNSVECDTEIIDYVPPYLFHLFDFLKVDSPKWQKNWLTRWAYRIRFLPTHLSYVRKYFAYKKFNREYLPLSSGKYTKLSEIKAEQYDVLFCGSDQIWNSANYPCGEDPAYYLSFSSNSQRKVSYAASFGCRNVSPIGEENIRKYLPSFDAVSVREKSGVNILENYGINAEHVVDPVLLLDALQWRQIAVYPKEIRDQEYILVYGYDNSQEFSNLIAEATRKLNCRVITSKDPVFRDAGPREFLGLIDNARLVLTTSFHAVAFSIILHTNFVTAMTGNEEMFERIQNIEDMTGLQDRRNDQLCKKENWEREVIDFDTVDSAIQPFIHKSKTFLEEAIQQR